MENPGWQESFDQNNCDVNFLWHTTSDEEICEILMNKNGRIINRYPFIKHISRKDNFEGMMAIAADINSDTYNFVPR